MATKYVSLDEAALILGLSTDEVNALRESGELRGFADRGTWKFRKDSIDELARSRSFGSDPDITIIGEEGSALVVDDADPDATSRSPLPSPDDDPGFELGDSGIDMVESFAGGASTNTPLPTLAGDDAADATLDFDMGDADSDPGADDTARVPLENAGEPDQDDSARFSLGSEDSGIFSRSADDSGINLVSEEPSGIVLDDVDSGLSLEAEDESGIALDLDATDESGLTLDTEDGESGIALDLGGESGIALDMGDDSGIALDLGGESGIALDLVSGSGVDADSGEGTQRMAEPAEMEATVDYESGDMDDLLAAPHTGEVPAQVDSEFDVAAEDALVSDEFDSIDEIDEYEDEEGFDDEYDAADELEEVDEFDDFDDDPEAGFDDDPFEDDIAGAPPVPGRGGRSREASWGAATAVGLVLCACVMVTTMLVTWQSMRVMWSGEAAESPIDPIVDAVTGLIP